MNSQEMPLNWDMLPHPSWEGPECWTVHPCNRRSFWELEALIAMASTPVAMATVIIFEIQLGMEPVLMVRKSSSHASVSLAPFFQQSLELGDGQQSWFLSWMNLPLLEHLPKQIQTPPPCACALV